MPKPKCERHKWVDGRCAKCDKCKRHIWERGACVKCEMPKPFNSNDKGGKAEREVARIIEPWWQRYESTAEFVKTPRSGGWGKSRGRAVAVGKEACGDICTNSDLFPFCVEVKWRENWSEQNVLDGKPTPPWGWWVQCIEAANEQGGVPLMWMRKNHVRGTRNSFPWLVWVPLDYVNETRLSTPDIQWSSATLEDYGVDYGGVLPVAYVYTRFIEMAARRMRAKESA